MRSVTSNNYFKCDFELCAKLVTEFSGLFYATRVTLNAKSNISGGTG